jgi:hypothetical protein
MIKKSKVMVKSKGKIVTLMIKANFRCSIDFNIIPFADYIEVSVNNGHDSLPSCCVRLPWEEWVGGFCDTWEIIQ